MPWSIAGLDERLTGFGIRGLRGAQGRAVISRSVILVPAAVSSAVARGSKADPAGRPLAKASIAGYHSFFCALSAILSATSLIAPLALPTAF
jgi:hypothetical protein